MQQEADEHQAQAAAARVREAEREAEDFKNLMAMELGRRFVWRLLDSTGVFRLSFNTDTLLMAFAEGRRNEGLRLLAQIHSLCPEQYPLMQKENRV